MEHDLIAGFVLFFERYTFGLYLIHWYILVILIKTFNMTSVNIFALASPVIAIGASVGIIWLMRKSNIFKIFVP